jgi:hypothetical protein
MQTETYEVESDLINQSELDNLINDGQTELLIEELGLGGQKTLLGKSKVRIPYRVLTFEERFVFKTLFPERSEVKAYSDGPIPLRAMEVIKTVRELDHPDLGYLEIWHPKKGLDDPILVARKSTYSDPVYLLARWGQALLPFDQLRKLAIEKAGLKVLSEIRKFRAQMTVIETDVQAFVEGKILSDANPDVSLYGV